MRRNRRKNPSRSPIRKQLVKKIVSYYETLEKSKSRSKSRQSSAKKTLIQSPKLKISSSRATVDIYKDNLNRMKKLDKLKFLMKAELNKAKTEDEDKLDEKVIKKAVSGYPSFMQKSNRKKSPLPVLYNDQENIKPHALQKKVYQNLEEKIKQIESEEKSEIRTSKFEEECQELYPLNTNQKILLNNSAAVESYDFHERKSKEIRRLQYTVKLVDSSSKKRKTNGKRRFTSGKKRREGESYCEKILDMSHQDIINRTLKNIEEGEKREGIQILTQNLSLEESLDIIKYKKINKILEIDRMLGEEKMISQKMTPKPIEQPTSKKKLKIESSGKKKKKVLIPKSNLLEESITRSPRTQLNPTRHILSPKNIFEEDLQLQQTNSKKSNRDENYPIWVKFKNLVLPASMTCRMGFKLSECDELLEVREGDHVNVSLEKMKLKELSEGQLRQITPEFQGVVIRPNVEEEGDCQLIVKNGLERFMILIDREDEFNDSGGDFEFNCTFLKRFNHGKNEEFASEGKFQIEPIEEVYECFRGYLVDEDNFVTQILVYVSQENSDKIFFKENKKTKKIEAKVNHKEKVIFEENTEIEGELLTLEEENEKLDDRLPKLVYYIKDKNLISRIHENSIFEGEKGHILCHDGSVYGGVIQLSDFSEKEFLLEINNEFSIRVHPIFDQEEDISSVIDKYLNKIKEIASEAAESRRQETEGVRTERDVMMQKSLEKIENEKNIPKMLQFGEKIKRIELNFGNLDCQNLSVSVKNTIVHDVKSVTESESERTYPNTSREAQSIGIDSEMIQNVKSLNESRFKKKKKKKRRSKQDRRKKKKKSSPVISRKQSMRDSLENISKAELETQTKFKIKYKPKKVIDNQETGEEVVETESQALSESKSNLIKSIQKEENELKEPNFDKKDSNEPTEVDEQDNFPEKMININQEDMASESAKSHKKVPSRAQNTSNKKLKAVDFKHLDPVNKLRAARNKNSRRFLEEFNRSLDKIYYNTTGMKKKESRNVNSRSNSKKRSRRSSRKGECNRYRNESFQGENMENYGGMEFNFETQDQSIGFSGFGEVKILSKDSSGKKRINQEILTPMKATRPDTNYSLEENHYEEDMSYLEDEVTPDKEKVSDVIKALRKLEDNVKQYLNFKIGS